MAHVEIVIHTPHAPTHEFTHREERWRVACWNGAWLALTERRTSDALVGVVAGQNGWSSEKASAMREFDRSDVDGCC